ncbi:Gfo/Idh/MocA family protein [Candidatus Laterigemmans baculatus]|uniref:Gfo/Idh/MocA family protein n=1 Tax=Candidatus Laterigemmans baculatus TaxID=2770505 RepID=UPI0013D95C77|nr:Gfo/Idh/MocA family oxidoreductase [Candidatus Laterigemmans baculatus]
MTLRPRLLVIGGGSIGERHVRCFQHTERVEVAICDTNEELCATLAERYGLRERFSSFDAACASEPDLAVLCTPAHLHVAMATRLIRAGVPVLIEKPLGVGLEGVDELLSAAETQRVTAGVAYVYRAHPALGAMRQAIQDGRFGQPVQVVAVFGQHFPFYRPAYREIYYRDRTTGGGAIQDALTHVINAAEWLVGPVTELVADADHLVLEGVQVEDTVHVLARHRQVMAAYSLNQHQPANEGTLTVVCERGVVRFEIHRGRWMWCEQPAEPWQEEPAVTLERDDLFRWQAAAFLDAVEGRVPPLCTLEEGLQTLRVNLAALRSTESRAWEAVAAPAPSLVDRRR